MTDDNVVALEQPSRRKGPNRKADQRPDQKINRPPPGQPFYWVTQEVAESDAWRTLSKDCNARTFVDFLLLGHMSNGGRQNGNLKAPYQHLEQFGIGARFIAGAIRKAEQLGLVICHRGGMRVATTYTLTWLALHDGTPPSDEWRAFRNPKLKPGPQSKKQQQRREKSHV